MSAITATIQRAATAIALRLGASARRQRISAHAPNGHHGRPRTDTETTFLPTLSSRWLPRAIRLPICSPT